MLFKNYELLQVTENRMQQCCWRNIVPRLAQSLARMGFIWSIQSLWDQFQEQKWSLNRPYKIHSSKIWGKFTLFLVVNNIEQYTVKAKFAWNYMLKCWTILSTTLNNVAPTATLLHPCFYCFYVLSTNSASSTANEPRTFIQLVLFKDCIVLYHDTKLYKETVHCTYALLDSDWFRILYPTFFWNRFVCQFSIFYHSTYLHFVYIYCLHCVLRVIMYLLNQLNSLRGEATLNFMSANPRSNSYHILLWLNAYATCYISF